MRMRIASVVVVLVALGLATVTAARPQQGVGEPPRPREPAGPRAQLRARVAGLRAEVELLQLEHDGDAALMKELFHDLRALEASAEVEKLGAPVLEELRKSVGENAGAAGGLNLPFAKEFLAASGINPEEEARKQAMVDKGTAKVARKMYDRLKDEFLAKAAALYEKKLDLDDLEHQRNASR